MGSGIKGLHRGGIRDLSPGIWDHNRWDRDQQCCHGIRDQAVTIKITKYSIRAFTGICYFEISFHTVFHGISLVFGFMNGQYWLVT